MIQDATLQNFEYLFDFNTNHDNEFLLINLLAKYFYVNINIA